MRAHAANGSKQYTIAGPARFVYDRRGNLSSDGAVPHVYDVDPSNGFGRIIGASGAKTANLSYNSTCSELRSSAENSASFAVSIRFHNIGSDSSSGCIDSGQSFSITDAIFVSFSSSTKKRGSTSAGSQTTRSRKQAGPPPLAIDWRTSTGMSRRIGPLLAIIDCSQAQTRLLAWDSVGTMSAMSPLGSETS